jgi:twinkle protein
MKDANECLTKGIDLKDVQAAFDGAQEFKHDRLERVASYEGEIIDIIENPMVSHGTLTGLYDLDNLLKGWRAGEVTLWTGYNGAGKSTILGQMMLHLAEKRIPSCIASMELPPKRYLRWQVLQVTGNNNSDDARKAIRWLNNYEFVANYQNTVDRKDLMGLFEYAARKYGVKHFVIDSLMKIKMDLSHLGESQKEFVDQLTYFAKRYDAHVHLVAHPRKGESDSSEAGKMDVKGASEITDLVDNVIVIGRSLKGEMNECGMVFKKNREHGYLGQFPLNFDDKTKRFSGEHDIINFDYKGDEWNE